MNQVEAGGRHRLQLPVQFETNLDYMRPGIENKIKQKQPRNLQTG